MISKKKNVLSKKIRLPERYKTMWWAVFVLVAFFGKTPVHAASFPFLTEDWIEVKLDYFVSDAGKEAASEEAEEKEAEEKDAEAEQAEETVSLSEEEKEILYKVVSMECDTGYEGSLAVISCMLNRTESDQYPDDLMEVVKEDSQFTAYYNKETDTYPYLDREPSKECIAAVDDAIGEGKRNLPSYILYFRSSDYESLTGYETYGQIGDNTYFYTEEDREGQ